MQAEIVSDVAGVQGLRDEWNDLASKFPSPLLRYEWYESALLHLHPKNVRPVVVVIRSCGRLRALAPLICERHALSRKLVTPGGSIIHEPFGIIHDGDAALIALLRAVVGLRTSLCLPRLDVSARETALLRQFLSQGCLRVDRNGGSSFRVPLKKTWSAFEASMTSGRRSDLRSYRRRAEKHGPVEFTVVTPQVHELTAHFSELLRIEASGWKGREGTAILCDPQACAFYEHYARMAAWQGMLRFFFLRIGSATVSARMAVECGGRLWDLRLGYDEKWRRCAPGILLTHETLRYAVERGLDAYEFLGGGEAWERHWPCEESHHVTFHAYPLSFVGQMAVARDGCMILSQKVSKSFRGFLDRAMPGLRRKDPVGIPVVVTAGGAAAGSVEAVSFNRAVAPLSLPQDERVEGAMMLANTVAGLIV